jgi:hypothetical protein
MGQKRPAMKIRLVGPDDVLPRGRQTVSVAEMPRSGDMIVAYALHPGIRFRVVDVCWYAVASSELESDWETDEGDQIPDVVVEVEGD